MCDDYLISTPLSFRESAPKLGRSTLAAGAGGPSHSPDARCATAGPQHPNKDARTLVPRRSACTRRGRLDDDAQLQQCRRRCFRLCSRVLLLHRGRRRRSRTRAHCSPIAFLSAPFLPLHPAGPGRSRTGERRRQSRGRRREEERQDGQSERVESSSRVQLEWRALWNDCVALEVQIAHPRSLERGIEISGNLRDRNKCAPGRAADRNHMKRVAPLAYRRASIWTHC
jgi:hypothetical protein